MTQPRHMLSLLEFTGEELKSMVARASELRKLRYAGKMPQSFAGKQLAMVFEKSSTRTRVSFEAGMRAMGGHALFLSSRDLQLGRGEPVEDTARVLSRMVDAVMLRSARHDTVERFAAVSRVPVVNGLTDKFHPCQLLADMQTFVDHRGPIAGKKVVWLGDGNNVCNTFITAAMRFDFELTVACPEDYLPDMELVAQAEGCVRLEHDPHAAMDDTALVVTDVWVSMGQEEEAKERQRKLADFQLNSALLSRAPANAIVMHCLPAKRGEEITDDVIEGPQCVVWDEAENRLYAQCALLEALWTS